MSRKKIQSNDPLPAKSGLQIVFALLDWFSSNARDLPWRRTRDPYAIWVSEIMLQQTQVKTVIPYWEKWMRTLPTIHALADADTQTIHKLWEGLGYYTRVRNLQQAAKKILTEHHGQFPRDHQAILDLPGIGPYTAGAISSIAFNEARPILDGNVIRVLTRLFAIAENPREKATNKKLWQIAGQLVTVAANLKPKSANAEFLACSHLNQSLMELGALICTPRQPSCPACPLRLQCRAYRTNRVEQFPQLAARAVVTRHHYVAFVMQHRGRYLVRQRPAGQVNAHLWEFPNLQVGTPQIDHTLLAQLAQKTFGIRVSELSELRAIKHSITRYRITLQSFAAIANRVTAISNSTDGEVRWLTLAKLNLLPFTSAHRKILRQLFASQTF